MAERGGQPETRYVQVRPANARRSHLHQHAVAVGLGNLHHFEHPVDRSYRSHPYPRCLVLGRPDFGAPPTRP